MKVNPTPSDETTGQAPRTTPGQWPAPRTDLSALETEPDRSYTRQAARFHLTLGALRAALEEQPTPNLVRATGRRWLNAAAHVIDETGAQPWRMTTADYLAAVADHGANVGRVTPAPWDPGLAPAMREHAIAVFEETVWETLREDLLLPGAAER